MTHESHAFTTRSFSKIYLSGGPFNVRLYRNTNPNDTFASVDVEAEPSLHPQILIEIDATEMLTIRMTGHVNLVNTTNVTLFITYNQLDELHIDGLSYIQCLNQIRSDTFRLHDRGTGSLKLKFDVNNLDAYLHSIGRVKLCGRVQNEATLKSLGVGDVDCRRLLAKTIRVISSGIGNIYVTATDEINITLSGIGTVYYSGPLKEQVKTGLGNIMEMHDVSFINAQRLIDELLD